MLATGSAPHLWHTHLVNSDNDSGRFALPQVICYRSGAIASRRCYRNKVVAS